MAAAASVGLEMSALSASLSAPIDNTVAQPTVTVRSSGASGASATPAGYVRANHGAPDARPASIL